MDCIVINQIHYTKQFTIDNEMTITGKVATMAAVMTLFACNSKNEVHPLAPKNITIESNINDPAQSMATPGSFEAGDQISI